MPIEARRLAPLAWLLVGGCSHLAGTTYLSVPDPIGLELAEGTELIYERVSVTPDSASSEGILVNRVIEVLSIPSRKIEDRMATSAGEPLLGRTLIRLTGTAYRIETVEGARSGGPESPAGPTALFANSEAGIVRLSTPDAAKGRLVAPSRGLDVRAYFAMTTLWYVSNPDTTLVVPAGRFRCVETTWWEEPDTWLTFYWTDRIGLVAYVHRRGDPRAGPTGSWTEVRLVEIRRPSPPAGSGR